MKDATPTPWNTNNIKRVRGFSESSEGQITNLHPVHLMRV
jgi:hypothetical protein